MRSPKGLCPEKVMTGEAPNCQNATLKPGDFCEADEECGTGNINNCDGMGSTGWDIYYWAKGNVATVRHATARQPPPMSGALRMRRLSPAAGWHLHVGCAAVAESVLFCTLLRDLGHE